MGALHGAERVGELVCFRQAVVVDRLMAGVTAERRGNVVGLGRHGLHVIADVAEDRGLRVVVTHAGDLKRALLALGAGA